LRCDPETFARDAYLNADDAADGRRHGGQLRGTRFYPPSRWKPRGGGFYRPRRPYALRANTSRTSVAPINPRCLRASPLGYVISRDRYLKRDELGVIYQLCAAPGHLIAPGGGKYDVARALPEVGGAAGAAMPMLLAAG
jgi:hypothetical protein